MGYSSKTKAQFSLVKLEISLQKPKTYAII